MHLASRSSSSSTRCQCGSTLSHCHLHVSPRLYNTAPVSPSLAWSLKPEHEVPSSQNRAGQRVKAPERLLVLRPLHAEQQRRVTAD
ncbi:hypothetical protein EYF80_024596 [Liparis tanakae]|uniref:Uncharacterized protein n=1 Tax=Liparis tanakae TaxID=230148 RepID=A0A4Z2HH35_9TELE|nr:hypothetical protein EYF80_024596 [Liparis tanakae]